MADSGDVVKRITISATGENIDSTTSSVNSLSDAFDNVSGKSNSYSSLLASLTGGALVAGFGAVLDYIVKANAGLAEMATTANQVGLSLKDFQSIQFAGAVTGISTDQINAGLEKSASLLNDASRNSNSLSKELDANGISIKNANGSLISENQLLTIAAGLISTAKNPGDQQAIATMLGLTKEWIPLLEKGATSFSGIADAAQAAGAIIDDDTIKKATEFDAAWKQSSAEWSAYMKSAMADLLPYLDDLINRAEQFIQKVKSSGGGLQGIVGSLDPGLTVGSGDDKKIISIDTDGLNQATQEFRNAPAFSAEFWSSMGSVFSSAIKITSANAYPVSQDAMNSGAYPKSTGPKNFDDLQKQTDRASDDEDDASEVFSKVVAKTDDTKSAYDRATSTIQKYIEVTKAASQSVDAGAAEQEKLKAIAELTAAGIKDGLTPAAAALKAQMSSLVPVASAAAEALAKAKIAASISFGASTSLLSSEDVAIATQLKTIYPDVATALNSVEAAGIRTNTALKGLSSSLETNLTSGLASIANGTKSVSAGFHDMATSILMTLRRWPSRR